MIRVALPGHLRSLAGIDRSDVPVEVTGQPTIGKVLDALENEYPSLSGTIRDYSGKRRPFLRFFACSCDISQQPLDTILPEAVVSGAEPLLIVGAIAGG